jgi:hypothetical protein
MAAQYTLTLSDRQQIVLTWLVGQLNTERGTELTVLQFLQAQIAALLQPYDIRFTEAEAESVKRAFSAASAETKATVKTELGL